MDPIRKKLDMKINEIIKKNKQLDFSTFTKEITKIRLDKYDAISIMDDLERRGKIKKSKKLILIRR